MDEAARTLSFVRDVDEHGFAIVEGLLPPDALTPLFAAFATLADAPGRRDALQLDAVRALADHPAVRAVVEVVLGRCAFPVRATLFDKTPTANWLVAWHQDTTIPLRARREHPGFTAWSTKDGVVQARPPAGVLEAMLAVRVDLDGSDMTRGPLRVVPGSHRHGILTADALQALVRAGPQVACVVPAGGAVLMRPLVVHASSRTTAPGHRRVVHMEFAAGELPGGMEWWEGRLRVW